MKRPLAAALWLAPLVGVLACQSTPDKSAGGVAGSPGASSSGASSVAGSSSGSGSGGGVPSAGSANGGMSTTGGGSSGGGGSANGGVPGTGGSAGSGGQTDLPPLEECTSKPSIDRLTEWLASGEGTTVPATGTLLVKEGEDYVAKVEFVASGDEWHVIVMYIANQYGETVDLTTSSGFTLTYSATAELHVQLRSESHWSGGQQYATTIPSTGGKKETRFFSFAPAGWQSLFGDPVLSYADTLKEGMGLVFVGPGANQVAFYGLRIDGFTPVCN